jgi:phosphoglycerol transferase MdoB-like AlkP superfamily enzyme
MNSYKPQLVNLIKQIAFVFLMYFFCRLLFYYFNRSSFQDITFSELSSLLFYGLRFDAFSIAATNSLYILLCSLPFNFYYSKVYQKTTSIIFIVTNAIAISLNFIDFAYFQFTLKRTTFEVGNLIFGGQTEFSKLVPHFISNYWYLILLYVLFIWAFTKVHFKIRKNEKNESIKFNFKKLSLYFIAFALLISTTVLGIRGGIDERPIVLLDANKYAIPKYTSILINTPFSVLKSADLTELKPLSLFNKSELIKYYNPLHPSDTGEFKKINVCVIILESFSKEFTAIGKRISYTPFLDSLMSKSMVFENAIANGKTSINGIPAIIASMPSFLENQYLNSLYCNNKLQTLPNLLKEKGYSSVFYHGGTNGTINLNSFAQLAGYDNYFGRTEYNKDEDYDGQWGIWDEPFLKKTVTEMSTLKQPFFTSIFTLSSHNPYKVPKKYEGKFPKGNYEITESIGYADYALNLFFKDASKQPWFNNTLFVITPDHTSISNDQFYSTILGQYSIPIILFKNDIMPQVEQRTVQQIDILPTVLDYLNYDKPFYSLGKSMLAESEQPSMYYIGPHYCCVKDSFFYILNDFKLTEKYNFKKDSLLKTNLLKNKADADILNFSKAYIQNYTNDVIENKVTYINKTKK